MLYRVGIVGITGFTSLLRQPNSAFLFGGDDPEIKIGRLHGAIGVDLWGANSETGL
jgi:hypothetical protein